MLPAAGSRERDDRDRPGSTSSGAHALDPRQRLHRPAASTEGTKTTKAGTDIEARLFQVLQAVVGVGELTALAEGGLDATLGALGATTGAVYLLDEGTPVLRRIAARNLAPSAPVDVALGEGLVGEVAKTGKARVLTLPTDPAFVTRTFLGDIAPRAIAVCPLPRPGGQTAGVLAVASPGELDEKALEVLGALAPHFANALLQAWVLHERDRAATYYGRILSDVDAAVVATDREGRVTIWNPAAARLWGIESARALGNPIRELGLARDLVPLRDALHAVFAARAATTLDDVSVDPPGGGTRLVRIRISPLTSEDGELSGAILIGVDVTDERKRMEELGRQKLAVESLNAALRRQAHALAERQRELEAKNREVAAANRAKSDFISTMSHELRTPLNSIRGFCRLLIEDQQNTDTRRTIDEKERKEFLEIIDRNGRELLSLIDDILDLAKADAGRLTIERSRVAVELIAGDIVDELAPLAKEKKIALVVDAAPGLPAVETDEHKLRRICRNLVANAIKFTHEGGVTMRLRPGAQGGVVLAVEDTGIGIAPEDQERIFNPFEQVDSSRTRRYGGSGLGLSIVRRLASVLGAGIHVKSTVGRGSTFAVELPSRAPDANPRGEGSRVEDPPTTSSTAPVVLVADDDPHALAGLDRALAEVGLGFAMAGDGREAVTRARELAREGRLAAVALDVVMPEMDGYEALETLKADPLTADVPVFLITIARTRDAGIVLGACEVVSKPIVPTVFAQKIAGYVRQHPGATREPPPSSSSIQATDSTPKVPLKTEPAHETSQNLSRSSAETPIEELTAPTPAHGVALKREARPEKSPAAPRSLEGKAVLIVEDNEDSARLAKLLLEQRGGRVTLAADAGAALAHLRKSEFAVVIMDLMLPGLDGYEATRAIRAMPDRATIPIVAATAAVLPGDRARALEAGCDDIVAKPYDVEELVSRALAAIEKRSQGQEREAPAQELLGLRPRDASHGGRK